jgi:glycosyltransferase involved in cell wall biosynthesis
LLYPFPAGPTSTGLNLEVAPLYRELTHTGHEVDVFLWSGKDYLKWNGPSPPETQSRSAMPTTSAIREPLSLFVYQTLGLLVPPIFHLREVGPALSWSQSIRMQYDVLICFKPWFRTVLPVLSYCRKNLVPSVLVLDDYDVSSAAWYISKFDLVVVLSEELNRIYRRSNPILLRHTVDSIGPPVHQARGEKGEGALQVLVLFPGTGYPGGPALELVRELGSLPIDFQIAVLNAPDLLKERLKTERHRIENTRLLPLQDHSNYRQLLQESHVAVVLQPHNAYGRAKVSARLLDCMATGLCVVVPDFGEAAHVIRQSGGGLVVSSFHPQEIAEAVGHLLRSPQDRQRLGEAGFSYVATGPTWSDNAIALVESIEGVRRKQKRGRLPGVGR